MTPCKKKKKEVGGVSAGGVDFCASVGKTKMDDRLLIMDVLITFLLRLISFGADDNVNDVRFLQKETVIYILYNILYI